MAHATEPQHRLVTAIETPKSATGQIIVVLVP